MNRVTKLACAALIALTLALGAAYAPSLASSMSTPMAMMPIYDCPEPPEVCDPPPALQEDATAYKKGSFDITETESAEDLIAVSKGKRLRLDASRA
jgi:hypothetical protein